MIKEERRVGKSSRQFFYPFETRLILGCKSVPAQSLICDVDTDLRLLRCSVLCALDCFRNFLSSFNFALSISKSTSSLFAISIIDFRCSILFSLASLRKVFKTMLARWRCQPIKSRPGKCEPIGEPSYSIILKTHLNKSTLCFEPRPPRNPLVISPWRSAPLRDWRHREFRLLTDIANSRVLFSSNSVVILDIKFSCNTTNVHYYSPNSSVGTFLCSI